MIVIKSKKEIELMREACKISAEALQLAGESVKPGISTKEIDNIAYKCIVKHKATPNFLGLYDFPATACISVNDEVIHGIPSADRIIKDGDIVSIDLGAEINGYNGDNAATFAAGSCSPEAKRLMDVTAEGLVKGIEAAIPGNRIGDIGYAVQTYCESQGFSVVRDYVGHGVGSKLHEDPSVPNFGHKGHGLRLIKGMTLAIEPMINQGSYHVRQLSDGWTVVTRDGKLSAHFEHTVAITDNGPEILTKV